MHRSCVRSERGREAGGVCARRKARHEPRLPNVCCSHFYRPLARRPPARFQIYKATKSWTFDRIDYPSDAVPTFAQGNALVLSRDLATEIADLARRPWFRLMADDVMVALVVAKFRPHELIVRRLAVLGQRGQLRGEIRQLALGHFQRGLVACL